MATKWQPNGQACISQAEVRVSTVPTEVGRLNGPLIETGDSAPIRYSCTRVKFMSEVVLIVDDDPVQRRLLETAIQRFGYLTIVADSGDAAVKLLTGPDARIDAMVLDLVMPDLDGLGVLAFMRDAGLNIPVIVQTAHGGIDNVVSAMRAGATDFVVKPASPERLEVSLAQCALRAGAGRRTATAQAQARRRADDLRRDHTIGGDAASPQGGGKGGRLGDIGADRRGIRRRQGIDRASDPRERRAACQALRRGELRRNARDEGLGTPRAASVDRSRDQFLADAEIPLGSAPISPRRPVFPPP